MRVDCQTTVWKRDAPLHFVHVRPQISSLTHKKGTSLLSFSLFNNMSWFFWSWRWKKKSGKTPVGLFNRFAALFRFWPKGGSSSKRLVPSTSNATYERMDRDPAPKLTEKLKVFISHTGQDQDAATFAAMLKETLDKENIEAFYDRHSIPPGADWQKKIKRAVLECNVFVAILSPAYFERYWCMLELDMALQRKQVCILPIYYNIDRPDDYVRSLKRFKVDSRTNEQQVKRWKMNVSQHLPTIQHLRRSYTTKDGDVLFKNAVFKAIQDLSRPLSLSARLERVMQSFATKSLRPHFSNAYSLLKDATKQAIRQLMATRTFQPYLNHVGLNRGMLCKIASLTNLRNDMEKVTKSLKSF